METQRSPWADFFSGANKVFENMPEAAFLKFLPAVPKGHALDVGAGMGQNSVFLARQGFDVEALEQDKDIALKCRERMDKDGVAVKVTVDSIENHELPENKYSLIVAAWVFQFIAPDKVLPVLKKLEKALAPGGFLYIGTFSVNDAGFVYAKNRLAEHKNTIRHEKGILMHYFESGELEKELAHMEDVLSVSGTRKDYSHGEPHTHGFIELVRRKH